MRPIADASSAFTKVTPAPRHAGAADGLSMPFALGAVDHQPLVAPRTLFQRCCAQRAPTRKRNLAISGAGASTQAAALGLP